MENAHAFFEACRSGDMSTVETLYNGNNELLHVSNEKGFDPLIIAVYNNQPEVVGFLLNRGANTSVYDASGNTALMGVCFRGYKEIAQKLVEAGADVNQRNFSGATALTFAATFGHLEIAEMLLKHGADQSLADSRGKTPLHHAVIQENEAMIDLLQRYQKQ